MLTTFPQPSRSMARGALCSAAAQRCFLRLWSPSLSLATHRPPHKHRGRRCRRNLWHEGPITPHPTHIHTHTHTHTGTQAPSEKIWLMSLPYRKKQPPPRPLGPANLLAEARLGTGLGVSITFMGLHAPVPALKSCTAKWAAGTPSRSISSGPGMEETLWKKPLPELNQRMSRSWSTE